MFISSLTGLDRTLLLLLNGDCGVVWDNIWWYLSRVWIWAPLYAAMAYIMFRSMDWKQALIALSLVVLGMVLADHTANFFKGVYPRLRPSRTPEIASLVHTVNGYIGGMYGTVSSHASTTMSIAVTSAGIIRRRWWSVLMVFYVGLTCFSRIYLGVHFPLDIVYGLTTGLLYGILMLLLWNIICRRWGDRLSGLKEINN